MRIAILGTRGIPNHYGGFEQYAELLSVYLVNQGWEVVVYNSSDHPYKEPTYKGVTIKHIYDPEKKWGTAGQFLYDLGCILDTRKQKFDIVYQLGYTSSAIFNFLFPGTSVIVTNMDGLEWKRTKYNRRVQQFLKYSERLVAKKSDHLVADSLGIQSYLEEKYGKAAFYSAYTADLPPGYNEQIAAAYGLQAGQYDLLIARMEPENNIETILEGYSMSDSEMSLVVIGNVTTTFGRHLTNKYHNTSVRFLGAIYDKVQLDSLRHFSRLYFHGHSVGGTNPSLLEAMACGCSIVAHDNPFNRGVLNGDALYFKDAATVCNCINSAKEQIIFFKSAIAANTARVANLYSEAAVFHPLSKQLSAWNNR